MAQLISLQHRLARHFSRPNRTTGPHMVIDFASFRGAGHVIPPLQQDINDQLELRIVKRIREVLHEDYRNCRLPVEIRRALFDVRQRFIDLLKALPYRQLVEEGHINQLLDDYLGLLLVADEKQTGASDREYIEEREYYHHHRETVKAMALQLKYLVIEQH